MADINRCCKQKDGIRLIEPHDNLAGYFTYKKESRRGKK